MARVPDWFLDKGIKLLVAGVMGLLFLGYVLLARRGGAQPEPQAPAGGKHVVRAAGASYCMDELETVRNIEDAGFAAKRRNMHYEILGDPIFRVRQVPRMLSLATARSEGDTTVPPELERYPARSRAGKRARPS